MSVENSSRDKKDAESSKKSFQPTSATRLFNTVVIIALLLLLLAAGFGVYWYLLRGNSSNLISFFQLTFSCVGIILLAWFLFYFMYLSGVSRIYYKLLQEAGVSHDILLYLFFRRYNSYSLSAYFILLITGLLLLVCIGTFVYAEDIGLQDQIGEKNLELVFAVIIRIGIGSIAFYIVQVLLRLYRYNLRLANFYISLFDSLIMKEKFTDKKIEDLIKIMTPVVDVGKEPPPTLMQELNESLKNISAILENTQNK